MFKVTKILSELQSGDPLAADQLLPVVYDELRRLAVARLAQEKPGQTLQATALVHEAYLRLVEPGDPTASWNNRSHFFAAASEAMRRILVDQARRKKSQRRGGDRVRIDLDPNDLPMDLDSTAAERVLVIHEALSDLEAESPSKARLVKLRFFAGMTLEEAANALGITLISAKRDWVAARVWLYRRVSDS